MKEVIMCNFMMDKLLNKYIKIGFCDLLVLDLQTPNLNYLFRPSPNPEKLLHTGPSDVTCRSRLPATLLFSD
jgi:hypothetical protein